MTLKEEFLQVQTYEEFDQKRQRFRDLTLDADVRVHLRKIFPPAPLFDGDAIYKKNK